MNQPWKSAPLESDKPWKSAPLAEGAAVPDDQIQGTVFAHGLPQPNAGFLEQQADGFRYAVGSILRGDEASRADMIRSLLPDAEIAQDSEGRLVARGSPDSPYRHINSPGFDLQDVTDFAGEVVKFAPAAKFASLGRALLSRMALGGTAAAATSAASDQAAKGFGSEQDIDLQKAGFAAAGGAAGEVLSSGVSAALRAVGRLRSGASTADDALRVLDSPSERSIPAPDLAEAAGEFGVRLTRGQATGLQPEQAFENAALRGGRGNNAQQVMERFFLQQTDELRNARVLSGERTTEGTRDAATLVRDGLTRRAAEVSEEVNQAYQLARGVDASFDASALPEFADTMIKAVPEEIANASILNDPRRIARVYPETASALREIRGLSQRLQNAERRSGGRLTGVSFGDFERYRRTLNTAIDGAEGADRRALMQMKAAFDGYVDEAMTRGLFSGDENFLDVMKRARSARTLQGELFQPAGARDFGRKVVEDIVLNNPTPEETVNLIFGAGRLGQRRGVTDAVRQVKEIVGADSAEFVALKEAALDRIMAPGFGAQGGLTKTQTLLNSWDEALNGSGRSAIEELFTQEEVLRMARFQSLVGRMVSKPGAANTSNTAIELSRMSQSLFGRIPGSNLAAGAVDTNALRAQAAVSGASQLPRLAPPETALADALVNAGIQPSSKEQ